MDLLSLTDKVKVILAKSGITDLSESEFLVSLACGVARNQTRMNIPVSKTKAKKAIRWANMRASGVPLTIITKSANFYGRELFVNSNCLAPRPETEELVCWVGNNANHEAKVLDLCTGSGAIAITLFLEFGFNHISAADISDKALAVARKNAKNLGCEIKFIKSNLFAKIKDKFDVIVSNPPYVAERDYLNLENEVKNYEPKIALVGGADGLEFYRQIISSAPNYLNVGGKIFFEVGIKEAKTVKKLLEKNFENIIIKKDIEGIERMVMGTLKENLC